MPRPETQKVSFDDIRVIFDPVNSKREPRGAKEKRAVDLTAGAIILSFGNLSLRGRKLTSLEGLELMPELKTLYVQDNSLTSLRHLNQPSLETLHAERNSIADFAGCYRHPKLKDAHFEANPGTAEEFMSHLFIVAEEVTIVAAGLAFWALTQIFLGWQSLRQICLQLPAV